MPRPYGGFTKHRPRHGTDKPSSASVLERDALKKDDRTADFVTDACATVAIAYHRAAGVYTFDKEMQELGTAAIHLLTMATSYISAHDTERAS